MDAAPDPGGAEPRPVADGAQSLRQRIADELRASMTAGRMRPGGVYSAPTLAHQFGVSPTPVREAMLDLAGEGLVEPVRNKGFRVVDLSAQQLADITAVRTLLEVPTVVALAELPTAERHAALAPLYPVAHRLVELAAAHDPVPYVVLDRHFHLTLLGLAGNPTLVGIVGTLRARGRLADPKGAPRARLAASARDHERLLDLLHAGDAPAARTLMTHHIAQARPGG